MEVNGKNTAAMGHQCVLRVDRVVLTSGLHIHAALAGLSGFTTVSDHAVRNINTPRFGLPYGRVREMTNPVTRTKLFVSYNPRFRQLPTLRVTVVPDDTLGMTKCELEIIFDAFAPYEFPKGGLRVAELAIDFKGRTMNAELIRRHVRFGKSRIRPNVRFPQACWFGVPGSDHFLRCYHKPSVNGFRVEMQFNRASLGKHGIHEAADIVRLPEILIQQLGFYQMDWARLSAHVRRRPRYAEIILRKARQRKKCLNELLRFLRTVKIWNPGRFLIPLRINEEMDRAAARWAEGWRRRRD